MPHPQEPFEGLSELRVEDSVDEWVDAAVDVAEPGGQDECGVARPPVQLELDADGVDHVASEERNPADEEAGYKRGKIK